MNDLQQYATSLVPQSRIALSILTSVVSLYPHRNEAMCDTGAIAVSKDTGLLPGYGNVVSPAHATGWKLGKVSQEHGVLMHRQGETVQDLSVGDKLRIIPQHACLVCASQPWLYIIEDGGNEVVDVWVPIKGW
jgi:D-serine deaminase-like pyridoxal phosphate-dependent protein